MANNIAPEGLVCLVRMMTATNYLEKLLGSPEALLELSDTQFETLVYEVFAEQGWEW
jgi:hypothetical protein